jgi:predicted CoA-binding protein
MSLDGLTDSDIRSILVRTRRIAMVGASKKPDRA